jgi:hypothetical protein
MKCIYCNTDTTYPVRSGNKGQCRSCRHPFAFEPKTDPLHIADGLFQRAIKDVSGDGAVFFTEGQLYYEFNRRLLRKRVSSVTGGAALIGVSTVGGGIIALAAHAFWPLAIITLPGVIGGAVLRARARRAGPPPQRPRISSSDFHRKYLSRWGSVHGRIEKLLSPIEHQAAPAPDPKSPDVAAFSFDRALVTDHAETAAMLVANNFHFENNCAILSVDGYPAPVFDTVMTMLRRNPNLRVFAVHDASEAGCGLPLALRGERWFSDPTVQVFDLGLRPSHVQKMHMISLAGGSRTLLPPLRAALAPEEAAWLERGESVELAAVRPAKLMRSLFQGFARADQAGPGGGDADGVGGGILIWGYDGGADIQAADSFG